MPYRIIRNNPQGTYKYFPYIRCDGGNQKLFSVSPLHGRSFVVGRTDNDRYIVTKGNGLCYSAYSFVNTGEMADGIWGLLLRQDAERDFDLGQEVAGLGIKTNHMNAVLELDCELLLPNGHHLKPYLLQYDVECPYRISDAMFMDREYMLSEVDKWEKYNSAGFDRAHLIAADVLIRNLRIMHDNGILHNAISEQNYTWALELVDFELACSPSHPYTSEDNARHIKDLFPREIMHTYVIINYIAAVMLEQPDYRRIDGLFNQYGH